MKQIRKLLLLACLGVSSLVLAQDGCFYKYENSYLNIGAVRGYIICSKLPNGEYTWVDTNDFDISGGCWSVDKYPLGAIKEMGSQRQLRQCVFKEGGYEWVPYNSHA